MSYIFNPAFSPVEAFQPAAPVQPVLDTAFPPTELPSGTLRITTISPASCICNDNTRIFNTRHIS